MVIKISTMTALYLAFGVLIVCSLIQNGAAIQSHDDNQRQMLDDKISNEDHRNNVSKIMIVHLKGPRHEQFKVRAKRDATPKATTQATTRLTTRALIAVRAAPSTIATPATFPNATTPNSTTFTTTASTTLITTTITASKPDAKNPNAKLAGQVVQSTTTAKKPIAIRPFVAVAETSQSPTTAKKLIAIRQTATSPSMPNLNGNQEPTTTTTKVIATSPVLVSSSMPPVQVNTQSTKATSINSPTPVTKENLESSTSARKPSTTQSTVFSSPLPTVQKSSQSPTTTEPITKPPVMVILPYTRPAPTATNRYTTTTRTKSSTSKVSSATSDTRSNCTWKSWTSWSKCDCQLGIETRTREIAAGSKNDSDINGCGKDTRLCSRFPCPIDCVFSRWSVWSKCSGECQEGVRRRHRAIRVPALYGGKRCKGRYLEKEHCDITDQNCQKDCDVGSWSTWSQCQAVNLYRSCECQSNERVFEILGRQVRERKVIKYRGPNCPELQETKECRMACC